jgi:hypothetical protein
VTAVASHWVAAELLAHLAEPSDPELRSAWAAVRRLDIHCKYYNGSKYVLPFIGEVAAQIAHFVLGRRPADSDKASAWFSGAVGAVAQLHAADELEQYRGWLRELAAEVTEKEEAFAEGIWKSVVLPLVPEARTWDDFVPSAAARRKVVAEFSGRRPERLTAGIYLDAAAAGVNVQLSRLERKKKIDEILRIFPGPIRFLIGVLKRIAFNGLDLRQKRNRNTLWDAHIVFAISALSRMNHTPAWFVTNDRATLTVARDAGNSDVVMSLVEYENALALPDLP